VNEQTLALIKPGATSEGLTALIVDRYTEQGLIIKRAHVFTFHPFQAACFYKEHLKEKYFGKIIVHICNDCCLALILEGENALLKVRLLNGPSTERGSIPGTIRYDFRTKGGVVHGSDSNEAVIRETQLVFPPHA